MSFKKPFRAVPIKPSKRYLKSRESRRRDIVMPVIGGAMAIGAIVGTGSVIMASDDPLTALNSVKTTMVSTVSMRTRDPQPGDYWPGCDAARAAGTAPIYLGEPGYRAGMDGDGDGIACEPYRRH